MKHKSFLLLLVLLLTTIATHAYDFQSGALYYTITSETTVEVTYRSTNYQGLTTATIPETVIYNGTTYSVTSIGWNAFGDCSALTSITLPNSVTSIGDGAFYGCSSLTSVAILNSVTSIGYAAFAYCSSLTSITIPNSVTSIGYAAFAYCSSLTSIVVENGNTVFDSRENCNAIIVTATNTLIAGCQSTTIPNSVTSIGDYAFSGRSSLTSITIPNSVTSIGWGSFVSCSSLTSIVVESGNTMYDSRENCNAIIETASNTLIAGCQSTIIPNSVTSIGYRAFNGCSSLTSITLPNSVTSIGEYAFCGCSALTSITLPNSVTSIGDDAFAWCSSLTSITIPNSVTSIGEGAFYNVPNIVYNGTATGSPWGARNVNGYVDGYFVYADEKKTTLLTCSAAATGEVTLPNSVTSIGEYAFYECSSLTSIILPNSVTSIGEYAFYECSSLTSIILPNSVTTIGGDAFSGCSSLTSITIPNSVTSIGNHAFSGCSSLTSITIPNSVTSIEGWAFYGCSSLTSITIPNSVTSIRSKAFGGCSSLTSVIWNAKNCAGWSYYDSAPFYEIRANITSFTFGEEVETIPSYLCYGMSSLTSITIPNSVTSIGDCAFEYCSSLPSITLPNSVTSIGDWAFYGCSSLPSITLPNSVTSIGDRAFYGCSSLTSITIPNSVTSIGDYAFLGCSSLTSIVVESGNTMYDSRENCNAIIETATNTLISGCQSTTIPNSVTSIWQSAFGGCSSLTSITLPNSVTSIGQSAFYNCSSLTSITLPNSVTSIGDCAFGRCSSLTSIVVESGNTMYDSRENCNAIIETATNTLISGCQSTTIPNSVTSIGDKAFYHMSSLTSITIPNSVTSIGDDAFYNVPNIVYSGTATGSPWGARSVNGYVDGYLVYADETKTHLLACSAAATGEVTLPNSVTSIGDWAFYGCSSLTSITLPNSVTSIGYSAFYGCSALTSITCLATTPPTCGWDPFHNVPRTIPLYVPAESVEAYKAADTWKEFQVQALTTDATLSSLTYDGMLVPFFDAGTLHYTVDLPSETVAVPVVDAVANDSGATLTIHQAAALPGEASVEVLAADKTTRQTYTIYFSKKSTSADISNSPDTTETVSDKAATKLLRDGQVLILRNGETYDMMGQRL